MGRFKKILNSVVVKYGAAIASVAFMAVIVSANSPCCLPYYEPEEPTGLKRFKKFTK